MTHRFGDLGHGDTALIDAFAHHKDEITILPALHEQNASHMADGTCRASGKLAAVITSIGNASGRAHGRTCHFEDVGVLVPEIGVQGKPGCTYQT